uniref:Uncharacterized protein LOC113797352 n=1 Tax=Dermatophagoides pteronyssinus TaxID=6956 RepID=A0A6P6YDZ3_DERPT|nr:uncharacterized protein LOC113797352 [Dermatophagoides pteronyssinus]
MPTEMNQYSVDINNNINDDNNTNKNHSILSPSKKSLSSMMNSKYRYSNSSLLFTSHYFLLWFAVFVFFDLRFWTINQNSASVEATIVCPKLNPVRKTPRFGKRSADYNKMYPFECLEFKIRLFNENLPLDKIVHSSEISKTDYELSDSLTHTKRSLVASSSATPPILEGNNILGVIYSQPNQFEKYLISMLNKRTTDSTTTSSPSVEGGTTVSIKSMIKKSSHESGIKDSNELSNKNAELLRRREILSRLFASYIEKLKEQNQQLQQQQQPQKQQ